MVTAVNPSLPVIAAQAVGSATAGLVLQPGAVVSAQVLKVADNRAQIAIANLAIDVLSEVPLSPGQTLQLAASQTEGGDVRLAIVGQGTTAAGGASGEAISLAPNAQVDTAANLSAAPGDPLTPLERMAVSVASGNAATQQQSLAPLFADLAAAAASGNLPPTLQQAVMQVLAKQTRLDQNLGGGDIEAAFQKSGLFLETSLASSAALPARGAPDLKAALIVLRQALASIVDHTQSPAAPPGPTPAANTPRGVAKPALDAAPPLSPEIVDQQDGQELGQPIPAPRAQLAPLQQDPAAPQMMLPEDLLILEPGSATAGEVLNLVQEARQEIPHASGAGTATMVLPDGRREDVILRTLTPSPPFRGALPSAQPVASASIARNAPLATVAHRLLEETDAALARQTLLQVASLPDRTDASGARIDPSVTCWNFEIPFVTPQGTAMAQFEISRDGGGTEIESAKKVWRARFSVDIEPAGPVHALVILSEGRTSVRMWADRPQTAARLRAGSFELSQALSRAELTPGDIVIRQGAPPQPPPARAGHFLDRTL